MKYTNGGEEKKEVARSLLDLMKETVDEMRETEEC